MACYHKGNRNDDTLLHHSRLCQPANAIQAYVNLGMHYAYLPYDSWPGHRLCTLFQYVAGEAAALHSAPGPRCGQDRSRCRCNLRQYYKGTADAGQEQGGGRGYGCPLNQGKGAGAGNPPGFERPGRTYHIWLYHCSSCCGSSALAKEAPQAGRAWWC